MRKRFLTVAILSAIMFGQVVCTQERDIYVGEVEVPSWRWGEQRARMEVANRSPLTKFIIAETELQYTGEYLNPNRRAHTCYAIPPGETAWLDPVLVIPGNYGRAQVTLRLFDVVDTMDIILPDQLAYEQHFNITFHLPDGMVPYFQNRIMLPPRVGNLPNFDNEFARTLFVLLNEGKSIGEIADLAICDTSFVKKEIENWTARGYIRIDKGTYKLNVPVISVAEAEAGKQLAVSTSDSLASVIAAQMDTYRKVRDSLIAEGKVPVDSNTFYDGGAILYHTYPVIGGLVLWWDLGSRFISKGEFLTIFRGNDLCNIYTPSFMYFVQGGPVLTGSSFYAANKNKSNYRIYYGDQLPEIKCDPNFLFKGRRKGRVRWEYTPDYIPKAYVMDSSIVRLAIDALVRPADQLLIDAGDSLQIIASSFGHDNITQGYKYWFWNITATRTMSSLVKAGVIERSGNGQFRFDGLIPKENK
ncbi:MAG: hypothetical protein DRP47_03400 [Candidatus Zixiibacteriota bacterium]|nr:MAG: hypothetical protein DRP47_03400 [candidate division Zixibacteria bacterium]